VSRLKHTPLDKATARYLAQKSERQRERLLGRRITKARLRKGRMVRQSNPWERWEDKLLGKAPDRQLARRPKRSLASVAMRRRLPATRRVNVLVTPLGYQPKCVARFK